MSSKSKKLWIVMITVILMCVLVPMTVFSETEDEDVEPRTPVSAVYNGDFQIIWDPSVMGAGFDINYDEGNSNYIEVTFDDGTRERYHAGSIKRVDSEGNEYVEKRFYPENDDMQSEIFILLEYDKPAKEGNNVISITAFISYYDGHDINYAELKCEGFNKWVSVAKPVKVEFQPADGFVPKAIIGEKNPGYEIYSGEGNKFVVTYEYMTEEGLTSSYERVFEYVGEDDTFWEDGIVGSESFFSPSYAFVFLTEYSATKGLHDYEMIFRSGNIWPREPLVLYIGETDVPFKVRINTCLYNPMNDDFRFEYTGKVIKPKLHILKQYLNTKIPESHYTLKYPKSKKLGWYIAKATFKEKYKHLYTTPVVNVPYIIGPAAPKITKAAGGKKSVTINWKKFSKKQLKNIDALALIVSPKKDPSDGGTVAGDVIQSKKVIKSGKYVLKNSSIKSNKKYYVYAYTKKYGLKHDGGEQDLPSKISNVITIKTK
ncbi:MAG: hypothetical protein IJH41_06960 [Eubacterium sp.]|nr:hypothetical protein [Eubacterium sp.]